MKKLLVSMLAFVLVFAACSSSTDTGDDEQNACDNGTIYMVTDTGGIDDRSFNQGTWEGIEAVEEDSDGVCGKFVMSEKDADYIPNLTTVTNENPDLVIAAGFLFEDAMTQVATDNPDQQYLLIDAVVQDEDGEQLPNVTSALFAEHEGSYLAGVAAALQAQADGFDKVGFVGGLELDLIIKFEVGFKAGVESVDPDMEVLVEYTGSFTDAAAGKVSADKLYNSGAYIIYHAAGNSGNGVIKSALEIYDAFEAGSADNEVWVIGVDRDQYEDGMTSSGDHSVILTSMVKKVGTASYDVSQKTLAGNPQGGGILIYDLENDGVGIPEENPNLDDEIVSKVEEAKEMVVSGEVEVPEERE